jgi:signal transduction histidine kinase
LNLSTNQLLYSNDPKKIEKYVVEADMTINSAITAVQHMTILDKLARGKIKPSFVQIDVTKLLLKSIDNKRLKWPETTLSLHGSRVLCATDGFFLELIINELLDNACRYKSSKVDLTIDRTDTKTRISLKDDGEGIEPDELAKVFEPYFRIKKHRQRNNRAGLGLTTVEKLTNTLDGDVKINSHPNWGTGVEIIF